MSDTTLAEMQALYLVGSALSRAPVGELQVVITEQLKTLLGAAGVASGLYHPGERCLRVTHAALDPAVASAVERAVGAAGLAGVRFPVSDGLLDELLRTPIDYRPSLATATFGLQTELVAAITRELGGIHSFLGLAYTLDRELLGVSLVARREGQPRPSPALLGAFAEMATVSLRREQSELAHHRDSAERERLLAAIDQVGESVMITNLDGSIAYVNPAFETVSGFTRAEVVGENPRVLKSGVQDREVYRDLWQTIMSGQTWQGRLVNKRKSGRHYTEDATISPVRDATGVITGFVGVKRDITQQLELEAQLRQAQRMESIGRLAGGVAHDFNNLLSVILSYTGFALARLPKGDALHEDLLEVQLAGERAAALTRQLLAFSRKQVLRPVVLDLGQVLVEMDKLLRRTLGEDIELRMVQAPGLGLVRADPGQLEQVLLNLAINARDAMPHGGRLTITTANIELDAAHVERHPGARLGAHVMLAVSDTGVGIDEQTQLRIFEPFFTTKELGKGTGLGLSTVHGIVQQSGGSITVTSSPGQGASFQIYLPRHGSGERPAQRRVENPVVPAKRSETILVVEDEAALLAVARKILEAAGYQVLPAHGADEALATSASFTGRIHLLLTDVVMPGRGGMALALALAAARPALEVLYMSGYSDDTQLPAGVVAAGTHFLAKPFTPEELLRKVDAVLGHPAAQIV
ncbi:MAG: PAS domain S-box protein [Deltaproteobacteria bacterium]|nr:PAS domain S-box protein [Deltaproteobacteria bacterium]